MELVYSDDIVEVEVNEFDQWPDEINDLIENINSQNNRYWHASLIEDAEFRELALIGVTNQQSATFSELLAVTVSTQYEDISLRISDAEQWIQDVKVKLDNVKADIWEKERNVNIPADVAKGLVRTDTDTADAIERLRTKKKAAISKTALHFAFSEYQVATKEYADAIDAFNSHAKAWPLLNSKLFEFRK